MVSVILAGPPSGVTVPVLQVASLGSPVQLKLTAWLKPNSGVMVSTVLPLSPGALTVTVVGFDGSVTVKSCTVTVIADDLELTKFTSPPYAAVNVFAPALRSLGS